MSPRRSTRLLAKQTDARLVDLCREGDERAFEAIVLRYRHELLGDCRRLGLSGSRSEDAVQQALLKGWLALNRGTEVHDLRPWLRRIVHNTALNLRRNSHEHREVDLDSPLVDAADVADAAPELRAAVRDTLSRVAALPAMQRDAMLLSAIEGRSHEEVASALGISHVAVRGLLYRARSTLRAGAAALIPAPLLGWATQTASRLATATSGIADWAGGGGDFGIGKALLEAAAVAGTAAAAVGAVFAPLHTNHHSGARAPQSVASTARPTGLVIQAALGPRTDQSQAQARSPAPGRPTSSRGGLRGKPVTKAPSTRQTSASEGAAPIPAPHAEQPKSQPPAGGPTASDAGSSLGANGETGSGANREAPQSAGAPEAAEPPGGEHEPQDGGSASEGSEREAEAAREQHEREAEAARERREREAEAAREQHEREVETAREQREREAEAAREQREREAGR